MLSPARGEEPRQKLAANILSKHAQLSGENQTATPGGRQAAPAVLLGPLLARAMSMFVCIHVRYAYTYKAMTGQSRMGPAMFFRLSTLADMHNDSIGWSLPEEERQGLVGSCGCLRVCIRNLHSKWGVPIINRDAQDMALVAANICSSTLWEVMCTSWVCKVILQASPYIHDSVY